MCIKWVCNLGGLGHVFLLINSDIINWAMYWATDWARDTHTHLVKTSIPQLPPALSPPSIPFSAIHSLLTAATFLLRSNFPLNTPMFNGIAGGGAEDLPQLQSTMRAIELACSYIQVSLSSFIVTHQHAAHSILRFLAYLFGFLIHRRKL